MAKPQFRPGTLGIFGAGLFSLLSVFAHLSHLVTAPSTLDAVRVVPDRTGDDAADDRDGRPALVFQGHSPQRSDVLRTSRIIPTHGTPEPLPLFPNRRDEEPSRANRGLPGLEYPRAFRGN